MLNSVSFEHSAMIGIQAVKSYGSVHSFFLKDEDDEAAVEKLVEMVVRSVAIDNDIISIIISIISISISIFIMISIKIIVVTVIFLYYCCYDFVM